MTGDKNIERNGSNKAMTEKFLSLRIIGIIPIRQEQLLPDRINKNERKIYMEL